MKYMLIMSSTRDGFAQYMSWPAKALEANAAFMRSFTQKLRESGELVSTYGLASPTQAKRVTAGKDGKPVTDGVFPESKEFLAGFWLVDVESPERAYEIAAEASTAPGGSVGGELPDPFWIEVRQVIGNRKELE
jgi:hypothetical protein